MNVSISCSRMNMYSCVSYITLREKKMYFYPYSFEVHSLDYNSDSSHWLIIKFELKFELLQKIKSLNRTLIQFVIRISLLSDPVHYPDQATVWSNLLFSCVYWMVIIVITWRCKMTCKCTEHDLNMFALKYLVFYFYNGSLKHGTSQS